MPCPVAVSVTIIVVFVSSPQALPKGIGFLRALTHLDLEGNKLDALPAEIGKI